MSESKGKKLDDAIPEEALMIVEGAGGEDENIELPEGVLELQVDVGTYVLGATLPTRAHPLDAGLDLTAASINGQGFVLRPGKVGIIPTGIRVAIPEGHAGLVCPRSGLAVNHGVTVLNGPGVIDPQYTGEVLVPLINLSDKGFHVECGSRIAQLLVVPVAQVVPVQVDDLPIPVEGRGSNGFGSTGR